MPVVRELISRFGFKVDKKQFNKAEDGFRKLKTAATAIVSVLVAGRVAKAVSGTVAEVARAADTFDKMSKRVGISTAVLQEYEFVAGLAGTTLGEFEIAIRRLQYSVVEAADGTATYADEFKKLGINMRGANGQLKSAEELLPELGDAMMRLKTDTERTAIAQKLLGRGGTALIPVLMQGTDAIMEQRKEARELGFIDEELIQFGVDWTDTQLRMQKALMVVKNTIAKALLPGLIKTGKSIVAWVKANKQWLQQKLGRAIKQLAGFVGRLVRLVVRVARGFYDWAKALDPLSARLLKTGLIAVGLAALLALPSGSLLLLIGLIALVIEDLEVMGEGGKSVSGDITKAFQKMVDDSEGIFGLLLDVVKWVWHRMIESFKEVVVAPIRALLTMQIKQILEAFKNLVPKVRGIFAKIPLVGRLVTGEAMGPAMARAGGGVGAAAGATMRSSVTVNVQARTGASAEEIGTQIAQQVDEAEKRRNREAMQALTPAAAGIVPGA